MKRVLVIGCSGSGKSRLAMLLSDAIDVPYVSLDAEHWLPGWVEPPNEAWHAKVAELVARESWVLDGNFGGTFHIRMPQADTIIVMDFPRWLCMWGVIRRPIFGRGSDHRDMAPGCTERFDIGFMRWVWNFKKDSFPSLRAALAQYGIGKEIVVLRTRRQVNAYLDHARTSR